MPFRALVAAPLRAALRRFVSGTSKPQLVLSSTEGSVGTLTLNNNERRNALSDALVEQ